MQKSAVVHSVITIRHTTVLYTNTMISVFMSERKKIYGKSGHNLSNIITFVFCFRLSLGMG